MNAPEFWVFVAFVIFVALVWKKASAAIGTMLDGRAERIRSELDEAERLHKDAQALLNGYQRRLADAQKDAEAFLAHAREEAARLRAQAGTDLEASLKRREAQAMDRIAQAEAAALAEVRNLTVDVAIGASKRVLSGGLPPMQADKLIEQSIGELPKHLH
ncbi:MULTISPECIES: F0F1 ATP synthase subunit B [unclassified Azospirillum]|jgi:F-type H+-transporting ATPase subunit b|uniref:F0F1 ATP synthase subunit B family protein n=1 Tax=unclassified Azospirillum TaxID=2630922 RepID=UPI0011EBCE57|nr:MULTISPECIES: F0F1 ATP synthase subunit B [unclassified Azospirillum]KAA0580951.1 F0F1 ATP synthase subunit B [Azospirillum sp. B21]MDR6771319.1 F-type H+-transporting ATPase subunit b [Azospirillum sp. BE72]HYF87945.1 F0F1 ATP synthase subunit B [Azospirillum sp.]